MADPRLLLALAGPARPGEPNPLSSLVMMGLIFAIFYFVLILPMRRKQKKLEALVKELKSGDHVIAQRGHLRHHRRGRGRRLPGPHRRQDQDQGPEERRGRTGARGREDGEVMPPALQNPFTLWLLLTAALAGLVYAFMRPELRWRAIGYGSFLLACAVAIWPPYDRDGVPGKIRLGLDLRGGIHLVLQVVIDDALNATVDDAVHDRARPGHAARASRSAPSSASRRPPSPWRASSPRG